jgi:threonine/homoserine/homoserine lactone efflux protein
MITLFLKGLTIGFAIAAPVGPIGLLCIQRSLHDGFKIGLMTGLGAALADGTYGLIAGFGLTAISTLFLTYQSSIQLIGGLFLIYLGLKLLLTPYKKRSIALQNDSASWHALGTTYLLTLTNPATILSFIAIFAGLGLVNTTNDYGHAIALVAGVMIGSAIWWLLLSASVAFLLRHQLSPGLMRGFNYFSGGIILVFGLTACYLSY